PIAADIKGLADRCCPGALTPKTTVAQDDPEGLQDFYGALTRLAGVKLEPVAGSEYADAVLKNGGTVPDRNHILPVVNGFSNAPTGGGGASANFGGYVLIWYRVPLNEARYAY